MPASAGRLAAAGLATLALLSACSGPSSPASRLQSPPGATYVGARTCGNCHAGIAASFSRTGMGRSLYDMDAGGSSYARIPDSVEIADQGIHYSVFERDGRYYMKQFQLDDRGREINSDTREMIHVIGSGNHSRSFVTAQDGRLYQMPLCWYPEADRWDLCPGYEIDNEHFRREVDDTCLFCHNGKVTLADGFTNRFAEPFPRGIGCERCHGPGSVHVERWINPQGDDLLPAYPDDDTPDPTILNPRRMTAAQRVEICLQCHLGDAGQTERVVLKHDMLRSYVAGQPLREYLSVFVYEQALPGYFGLGAQADRLALSRCRTEGAPMLDCVLCHDPHEEVYEVSDERPDQFDAACRQCHPRGELPGEEHSGGGSCVSCHMRRAEPHDQRYTTFLDHWIRRRPEDDVERRRDEFVLRPFFPEPAPHESPAARALARARAYYNRKLGSADGARGIDWDTVAGAFEEARRLDPGNDRVLFFTGRMWMSRGKPSRAEPLLREALEANPDNVDAMQQLGSSLLLQGRLEEASQVLEETLEAGPRADDEGAVLNELARVRMEQGRLEEARSLLDDAAALEPLSPAIAANLGFVARLEEDVDEEIAAYLDALRLSPDHPAVLRLLARALLDRGGVEDREKAVFAASRAVALGESVESLQLLSEACTAAARPDCALRARARMEGLRRDDPGGRAVSRTGAPEAP